MCIHTPQVQMACWIDAHGRVQIKAILAMATEALSQTALVRREDDGNPGGDDAYPLVGLGQGVR